MKASFTSMVAILSSIAVVAACSGSTDSELFGVPAASSDGTEPGSASSSGGASSSGASAGGSTSTSSSSTSSSSGATSSSSGSSGTSKDAGADAGWTSTGKGIWCGEDQNGDGVYCSAPSKECCVTRDGTGPDYECTASSVVGTCQGLDIKCDDHTDCASGQVCCGIFENNVGYKSVQCMPTCTAGGDAVAVRFCDPYAAKDECESIGKSCQWSQSLSGYGICR